MTNVSFSKLINHDNNIINVQNNILPNNCHTYALPTTYGTNARYFKWCGV